MFFDVSNILINEKNIKIIQTHFVQEFNKYFFYNMINSMIEKNDFQIHFVLLH